MPGLIEIVWSGPRGELKKDEEGRIVAPVEFLDDGMRMPGSLLALDREVVVWLSMN